MTYDEFLLCLRTVESGWPEQGNGYTCNGDGGKSIGPLQIQEAYWKDAMDGIPEQKRFTYQKVREWIPAQITATAYFKRYCKSALDNNNWETLARVHNGGPLGHMKKATLPYWEKVKAVIEEYENAKVGRVAGGESAAQIHNHKDFKDGFKGGVEVANAPIGQAKNPWGVGNPWDPATPFDGLPVVGTETDRKQPENGQGIDSTGLDKGTGTSSANTKTIGATIMNSGWASRKLWVTIGTMVSLVLVNVFGFESEQVNTAVSAIISAIGAIYVIVQGIIDGKKQAVKLQDSKNAGIAQ